MLQHVNHVVMAVRDLNGCRTFYTEALGLAEIHGSKDCLRIGPTVIE